MNIEQNLFKRRIILFAKLIPYGFWKTSQGYQITKNILNDTFKIIVDISSEGVVKGKIIDLSFNEEYINYRIESITGEFVNKVRDEFEKFLIDIRDNCTLQKYFISDQANRITDAIIKKYADKPEFIWDKFPGYSVFRNHNNGKWFALIAGINKSKITRGNEEVEIINVKLNEDKITSLLKKKGFYKAYHMNKVTWLTIILDDTLCDDEIISYINESYDFTRQVNEWIVPANPKYYDIVRAFNDKNTILWKQANNINVGDFVYLYVADPYSAILYKCEVTEVNIPYEYQDKNLKMSKVMKIKLLNKYNPKSFSFAKLEKYGIKAIRGPRRMPKKLSSDINK